MGLAVGTYSSVFTAPLAIELDHRTAPAGRRRTPHRDTTRATAGSRDRPRG
ncbi:hypothetical protein ACFW7K_29535 [Streptomyces sp. NPDC058735]|uniref:hypothetical protein n=1 Tax=Streptomyces sp. NPDC058735 TaxID=3346616 RepID=UPI003684D8CE